MKWFFALDEKGTKGNTALHTRMAVLSAKANTHLIPHLLYDGTRNEFTEWLESQGVTVIPSILPYKHVMESLSKDGRYSMAFLGHWQRTNICLLELDDPFVLYTDVDVVFSKDPSLGALKPQFFSAAPEFKKDSWNYFNSGVLLMNLPNLRDTYKEFERFIIDGISNNGQSFLDEVAYNLFYRGKWDRLAPELNWKPYWGTNHNSEIIHFHGPKNVIIEAIADGHWQWEGQYNRFIGSLFWENRESYLHFIKLALSASSGLPPEDYAFMSRLAEKITRTLDSDARYDIDLSTLDYKMFAEDA